LEVSISRTTSVGQYRLNRIGLGTNRLTDTPENRLFLERAVEAGVGLIDTAHLYTGGASERTVGNALAPFPDNVVVATKGGYHPGGGRPERLRAELEESFERLRTDTIALYYVHRVDPEVPLEETLSVLSEYRDAGRIRHVGVSEVSVDQIERARAVVPIAAVQNRYNLSEREHEDVVDFCERENIAFVPFFPLARNYPCSARRDRQPVRRNGAADHACMAPQTVIKHRPDSGNPLVRAFEEQPGRGRPRTVRRRLRKAERRLTARAGCVARSGNAQSRSAIRVAARVAPSVSTGR
jgi:aryl-alcohol dehydrogenase-like predicted oxidoreductase